MRNTFSKTRARRRGVAYIVALLLLSVFCTMGISMACLVNTDLQQCHNNQHIMEARLAAESGLEFMLNVAEILRISSTTTAQTFCQNMQEALAEKLEGTGNLAGSAVVNNGSVVFVPDIDMGGKSFCFYFTPLTDTSCQLKVRGTSGGVTRNLTMDFTLEALLPGVFDYGLASRGPVSIFGSAVISGINNAAEASVLSATTSYQDAISVQGNAEITGDLYTAGGDTQIVLSGSPTVGGTNDPDEIADHIHQDVEEPDFPEIDISAIAALATYTLTESDKTNKGTFTNVRIPAGMNPTFSSSVVLNGVVYVESPNDVDFEGGCTLNGIVVTEDAGDPISTCQLKFAGHIEAYGVSALPDTPEFVLVKQQTGTFILAPGFGVTFTGHIMAMNGSIAADQLTFSGSSTGMITGSVIGLEDFPTSVGGTVAIFVDRVNADPNPAGFVKPYILVPVPDSYTETTQ